MVKGVWNPYDAKTKEPLPPVYIYHMEERELIALIKDFEDMLGMRIRLHIITNGVEETRKQIDNYVASVHYEYLDDDTMHDLTEDEIIQGIKDNLSWVIQSWDESIARERFEKDYPLLNKLLG